ncbi:Phosphotransferase system, phosphocarrier protein HPr [gut metagenome]|uniref:Phosphotransferase system, phosphocarrier protein HPr n=1 Tax=gut metagenome TaxID=749906 RepID=J9FMM1_9ZZZZ
MISEEFTVTNKLGLHARPCALLSKTANLFSSSILLIHKNRTVDAKSILGLMTMAMPYNSTVTIRIEGKDEEKAMLSIRELFQTRFGEQ